MAEVTVVYNRVRDEEVLHRPEDGVFSVEEVVATNPETMEVMKFEPFFSFRHMTSEAKGRLYWYSTRKPSKPTGKR